jgi:uncharacterized protein involved in type VI secretion and phage assembly
MLRDWDPGQRSVIHASDDRFAAGRSISILLGYHSELAEVFSGVITGVTSTFPASSVAVVVVDARSRSVLLAASERPRIFEQATAADRLESIAGDYGLRAEVGASSVSESCFDVVSDWQRVLAEGREHGWVSYVRGDELVSREPAGPSDPPRLTYGTNILELRLREDIRFASDPSTVVRWDPRAVEAVTADADAGSVGIPVGARKSLSSVLQDSGLALRDGHSVAPKSAVQADVDTGSAGRARRQQLGLVSGTGAVIGRPDMRIDSWLELVGVGPRFEGPHYLSAVRHRLGRDGYTTEFTLGLAERLQPPTEDRRDGLAIGVVVDLDDPEGWGRVKVEFPWAGGIAGAVWARLATLDAGSDFGTLFVPAAGNEVVVGFAGRDPVVLGAMWNGAAAPPEAIDPATNDVRLIRTPQGHHIRFHDGSDGLVEIRSADGSSVRIDDAGSKVAIAHADGNSVVIDGSGIALTASQGDIVLAAASGKVKIEAAAIEGTASGPSKLESSATLDISASATLGLKGGLVNIN